MSTETNQSSKHGFARTFFLNILISTFIIMCYFYFSDLFGSISGPYINGNEFSVNFGVTLLIFTFLVYIAGSIHGIISGFLGELLVQLAFYGTIYLEWCFIAALFGLMIGLYKYKPLKFINRRGLLLSFVKIAISSLITAILITIFRMVFNPEPISLELALINYGVKFIVESALSIFVVVPLLLYVYDRYLAVKERHLYYLILTHHTADASDHTFYWQFGRTKIYLCSRCSGVIIGGILSIFVNRLLLLILNYTVSGEIALLLCIILPIPGIIDWGTQRMQIRKSTTQTRLITGFLIGVALHMVSFTYEYFSYMVIILLIYFTIFFILVYLGQRKEKKKYQEEIDRISSQKTE